MSSKTLIVGEDSEDALLSLSNQGFEIGKELKMETPVLPPDITELDDEDLIRLFQHLNSFINFIRVQVAVAQIDENSAKKVMEWREASASSTYTASNPKATVAATKAVVASDEDVIESSTTYSIRYNYRKLIEVMAANLESDMNLVSRELTRRTSGASFKTRANKFLT